MDWKKIIEKGTEEYRNTLNPSHIFAQYVVAMGEIGITMTLDTILSTDDHLIEIPKKKLEKQLSKWSRKKVRDVLRFYLMDILFFLSEEQRSSVMTQLNYSNKEILEFEKQLNSADTVRHSVDFLTLISLPSELTRNEYLINATEQIKEELSTPIMKRLVQWPV